MLGSHASRVCPADRACALDAEPRFAATETEAAAWAEKRRGDDEEELYDDDLADEYDEEEIDFSFVTEVRSNGCPCLLNGCFASAQRLLTRVRLLLQVFFLTSRALHHTLGMVDAKGREHSPVPQYSNTIFAVILHLSAAANEINARMADPSAAQAQYLADLKCLTALQASAFEPTLVQLTMQVGRL